MRAMSGSFGGSKCRDGHSLFARVVLSIQFANDFAPRTSTTMAASERILIDG
jgi:hypothetical protein